jgi:hypothetical protein
MRWRSGGGGGCRGGGKGGAGGGGEGGGGEGLSAVDHGPRALTRLLCVDGCGGARPNAIGMEIEIDREGEMGRRQICGGMRARLPPPNY